MAGPRSGRPGIASRLLQDHQVVQIVDHAFLIRVCMIASYVNA
jgi:hypothetical protein